MSEDSKKLAIIEDHLFNDIIAWIDEVDETRRMKELNELLRLAEKRAYEEGYDDGYEAGIEAERDGDNEEWWD
jgi:hypothetical protein